MQPNLRLIHSLTAPGGLLALRHLSRPLSLHARHFTRPPNRFSSHVLSPPPKNKTKQTKKNLQNLMQFSPARIVCSLRLQSFSLRLAPSSSTPDVGEVCVASAGSSPSALCPRCRFPHLLLPFPANYVPTPPPPSPNLLELFQRCGQYPSRALAVSSPFTPTTLASDFCAAAIGQETTVSSDCASSRLENCLG